MIQAMEIAEGLPIKQHPHHVNLFLRTEVKDFLCHGFASQSLWSLLHCQTKQDSFTLSRIENCIDRVGSSPYVTQTDLLKGYCQVPVTPCPFVISAFVATAKYHNGTWYI